MPSVQEQIRQRVLTAQERSTDFLPGWLRWLIRRTGGGDQWTARFIRGLLWRYRVFILIAALANLGAGAAEAATMAVFTVALNYVSAQLTGSSFNIDDGLSANVLDFAQQVQALNPIYILLILAVLLQMGRSSLDFGARAAGVYLRTWLEGDLQRRIFQQLLTIRYNQVSSLRLGNLTSYTAQARNAGMLVVNINDNVNDLAILLGYVAVLLWISWPVTLAAIGVLVLLSLALQNIRTSIRRNIQRFVQTSVRLNERLVEYLQGLRLVHVFGREEMVREEVTRLVDASIRSQRKGLLRNASITPLMQLITILAVAIFLIGGVWLLDRGIITAPGNLVTYVFILYRIMPRITTLNHRMGMINTNLPYLVRIADLLDPSDKASEYLPGTPITAIREGIQFEQVTLRYPNDEGDTLHKLDLMIPAGKMVAIVGASGAGKSSVFNLLLGLYTPTSGQIKIDRIDLQTLDLAAWRRLIGVVDQEAQIFSSSIADNIRFGKPDATEDEIIAAAKIANADEFVRHLPEGYATEVGDRGFRLSGGQRQRIAIARAVIHEPELLLFDEATSALDSRSERLIQHSLEELRQGRTIVVIAHRLSTIVEADKIIVLEEGKVIEEGTHQELLAKQNYYAALWQLQTHGE